VERLYCSVARTVVISPRDAWRSPLRAQAFSEQLSLQTLVTLGERLQRDTAILVDRAAFEGMKIPSASIVGEVRFADENARAAFMREYLVTVGPLLKKHGSKKGSPYRAVIAVYPHPEPEEGEKL
jgi:hypothetical protein